jgi:GT2 family glycosyltransferase
MLESLSRTTSRSETEVIVVAQPDASGSMAAEILRRYSSVHLIDLDENIGFGAANNLAIDRASADRVALLNPDLVLPEGWLAPLEDALLDSSVTIASPPLLTPMGEVDEAGQIMYADGGSEPFGQSGFVTPYERVMFSRDIDYASAACWLMRRSDFTKLGGFAPEYSPAYFEDVDLAFRVWKSGGRCRLVSNRPVIHDHASASSDRVALAVRSREVFRAKWSGELLHQPVRFIGKESCERVRDHRCSEHHRVEIGRRTSDDEARRLVDEAGRWAADNPTERATVRIDSRPMVEEWRRAWCHRGLEIVTTES